MIYLEYEIGPSIEPSDANQTCYIRPTNLEHEIVGISRWARGARSSVLAHAFHDNPLILFGEVGTGKEFIASLIHKYSARNKGPFLALSFEGVSPHSIEHALFGASAGDPGQASTHLTGAVESCSSGTLYINGYPDASRSLQAKIAKLVKTKQYCRLGDDSPLYSDVRVILGWRLKKNEQLKDILPPTELAHPVADYMVIPPLRDRRMDIDPLCRHFARECSRSETSGVHISCQMTTLLSKLEWSGNVAELKNVISHVVRNSKGDSLNMRMLPQYLWQSEESDCMWLEAQGLSLNDEVERLEIRIICAALKLCQGVQIKAARLLGVKPTTLNSKLKRYGITPSAFS